MAQESNAQVMILGALFKDGAVFQRESPVPVWGWTDPGKPVEVEFNGQRESATADENGKWRVTLQSMEAGGPFTLTASSDHASASVNDVWVGEVWLCAGQSNMAWQMKLDSESERMTPAVAKTPNLRLCIIPKDGTEQPLGNVETSWKTATPGAIAEFSAVGAYFGWEISSSEKLKGVAIGLIDCSYGGTVVEAWMSDEFLKKEFANETFHNSMLRFKPTMMYNAMVAPIVPYAMRGVCWYQGESNTRDPEQYARTLPGMIREWRDRFERPELPFFLVQLPNYTDRVGDYHFTWLRESQAQVARTVPNVSMAVSIDTADGYDLHPASKREVAHRLALAARARVYGDGVAHEGPRFVSKERAGSALRLTFDPCGAGLKGLNGNGAVRGFAVAGADGPFFSSAGRVEGNVVVLESPDVAEPQEVRYAWSGNPVAELCNAEGLPAPPFRTDSRPIADVEVDRMPVALHVALPFCEVTMEGDGIVSSLRRGGEEFIDSSDRNASAGAAFYSMWGAARTYDVRAVADSRLLAKSNYADVQLDFAPDRVTWTLRNHSGDKATYRINAGYRVDRVEPFNGADGKPAGFVLRAGKESIRIAGFTTTRRDEARGLNVLEVEVPPKGEVVLVVDAPPAG